MGSSAPQLVILGGPNGAGKTTVARAVVHETLGIEHFVNAEQIARGLSVFHPDVMTTVAGFVTKDRLLRLAGERADFGFESTLSSISYGEMINSCRNIHGYRVRLVFMTLSSSDLAAERVRLRGLNGGLPIPAEAVKRRYDRSMRNFFVLYVPLVDRWHFWDNSGEDGVKLVAEGAGNKISRLLEPDIWWSHVERYGKRDEFET